MDLPSPQHLMSIPRSGRANDLTARVRDAMDQPRADVPCPQCLPPQLMTLPVPVRKAHAVALKLAAVPAELWRGQLLAGSMAFEDPRRAVHRGLPRYLTEDELCSGRSRGLSTDCFGHIVPNYDRMLRRGLRGIIEDANAQRPLAATDAQRDFLDSVRIAIEGVLLLAARLADRCQEQAQGAAAPFRQELLTMADNLRTCPAGPPQTFWQAMQAVWLMHLSLHATADSNAVGRLDQFAWPYLQADIETGRLDWPRAAELVDCFGLKFNERAKTTDDQLADSRSPEPPDPSKRTRHSTSSQLGAGRDSLDATNHWLQNVVIGGLRPDGTDGTNPLTYLLLRAHHHNRMTNPVLTVRMHRASPPELLTATCEVLKTGGGLPAIFNDEALAPALERMGIPAADARDYTNDGCWEVIVPGRTDFRFQRLSVALCLEWALNRGRSRHGGEPAGVDTGEARGFTSFANVWRAFETQLDAMVGQTVRHVVQTLDDRSVLAPAPLLSSLIDGCIESRRDLTAGGAKYRTYALLAESAAHAIDSLAAIKTVIFEQQYCTMSALVDALDANFEGYSELRSRLLAAPKYGNDDEAADSLARDMVAAFARITHHHASAHRQSVWFPCGVGTFSWYIGIGEGLGPSADGRGDGEPVSSNFSPAIGRDSQGLPAAILSYSSVGHEHLPAGGPLDLRVSSRLTQGPEGTARMAALIRGMVESGGAMMTLTVADVEELRSAQRRPEEHRSLRVRMGGWSAYFTMLSRQQQDHHIRRQERQK
jgi:formate C-acetyltransferase